MALEQVIGDVRRDGEDRASQVLANARKEAEAILAAAREKAKAYEAERLNAATREAQSRQGQAVSRAESEARKTVLTAEAELRSQLRAAVLAALHELPEKSRQAHLKALVKRAQSIVPEGRSWGAAKDAKLLGAHKEYKHAGDAPIAGGLVVESTSGDARVDLSYETLLDEAWRDILRAESGLFAA